MLDLAEQRNLLLQIQPYPEDNAMGAGPQMSYRDYIVKELVDTERKYVQDLENLHDLKKTLEEQGALPGDVIYQIFLNINAILDFQRRFLIRVETTNSMPQSRQEWGSPFVYYEEAFNIYQPFIANQRKAAVQHAAIGQRGKQLAALGIQRVQKNAHERPNPRRKIDLAIRDDRCTARGPHRNQPFVAQNLAIARPTPKAPDK